MSTPQESSKFISSHGSYQTLQFCQMSEILHDVTVIFCNRFIARRSQTHDQMVQVARSIVICMIHRTNYLLDQQLRALGKNFWKKAALPKGCIAHDLTCVIGAKSNELF